MDPGLAAVLENMTRELKEIKAKEDKCEHCRGGHDTNACPLLVGEEQVDFVGGGQGRGQPIGFGNFNSGWRNSNNFANNNNFRSNGPPGFQIAQNPNRGQGSFFGGGSNGQFNKGFNGGKTVGNPRVEERVVEEEDEIVDEEIEMEAPGKVQTRLSLASTAQPGESQGEKMVEKTPVDVRPSPLVDHSSVLFPTRLCNQKYSREYGQCLDIFKQLKINLPFIEALQSMPKYAKFLKDLLRNKEKLRELSNVPLNGGCSAVVLNKLPEKLTDPSIFTIPCLFGSNTNTRALAELGASINLMPFSLYEKLDLGELSPTRMTLSLADRSVKYPRGIVENLLVNVDKFVFPADFVILDMEADERVPIILGRPFLRTAKALIDVHDGKITLRVGEESVTFEIERSMNHPSGSDDYSGPCHSVYFLNSFISCVDYCLEYFSGAGQVVGEKVEEELMRVDEVKEKGIPLVPEVLAVSEDTTQPPPLELKVLPSHLEYAFFGEASELPVIILSKLEEEEKLRLLEVLRANKEAIAWRLSDIKGISPSYCTHRILMEDDYKPVVQLQRRLNPNM
ncbi:uncharacterized protein LOC110933775 [Helianthus annuus]|uniref:uncharacterized protein LOC110933775 n=1 Tax=Helianthus annuus TaxID=4232 RepID=UPI000B8FCE97|nr:uncharacterized protein LOC110933775 [Helianthus annuus]